MSRPPTHAGPASPGRASSSRALAGRELVPLVLLGLGLLTGQLAMRAFPAPPVRPGAIRPVVIDPARAPAWKLTLLPGIGPVRARALVAQRARGSQGAK